MPHYCIATVDIKDPSFAEEYGPGALQYVTKHGGRYIARGPAVALEGDAPQVLVILEFPDEASIRAFHADPGYAPFMKLRQQATDSKIWMVPAV